MEIPVYKTTCKILYVGVCAVVLEKLDEADNRNVVNLQKSAHEFSFLLYIQVRQ